MTETEEILYDHIPIFILGFCQTCGSKDKCCPLCHKGRGPDLKQLRTTKTGSGVVRYFVCRKCFRTFKTKSKE